jgi:hypothetical protein
MSEHHHQDHDGSHADLGEIEARVLALDSRLLERGLLHPGEVDEFVYKHEQDIGPMLGDESSRGPGTARSSSGAWVAVRRSR